MDLLEFRLQKIAKLLHVDIIIEMNMKFQHLNKNFNKHPHWRCKTNVMFNSSLLSIFNQFISE